MRETGNQRAYLYWTGSGTYRGWRFYENGTERVTINQDGLTVNGTITATGGVGESVVRRCGDPISTLSYSINKHTLRISVKSVLFSNPNATTKTKTSFLKTPHQGRSRGELRRIERQTTHEACNEEELELKWLWNRHSWFWQFLKNLRWRTASPTARYGHGIVPKHTDVEVATIFRVHHNPQPLRENAIKLYLLSIKTPLEGVMNRSNFNIGMMAFA